MFNIEALLENRGKDTKNISKLLIPFFIHIIKWKIQPEKQSSSWMGTIKSTYKGISAFKNDVAYKQYSILNVYKCIDLAKREAEKETHKIATNDDIDIIKKYFGGELKYIITKENISYFILLYLDENSYNYSRKQLEEYLNNLDKS